jgi:hypothetical protein
MLEYDDLTNLEDIKKIIKMHKIAEYYEIGSLKHAMPKS